MLERSRKPARRSVKRREPNDFPTLLPEAREYVTSLRFVPDSPCFVCLMPFCGLHWGDENFEAVLDLDPQSKQQMIMIFAVRGQIHSRKRLSPEYRLLWNTFKREFPECPIARRSKATPEMVESIEGAWKNLDEFFTGWDTEEELVEDKTKVTRRVRHPKPPGEDAKASG